MTNSRLRSPVPVVVIAPGFHGHGIARSLGRLGVPVYGVHADARSPAAKSRYWRQNFFFDLKCSPPRQSVDFLLRVGQTIGTNPILIPTDDRSCLFVADHADALTEQFLFPRQPSGLARSLSSKESMFYLCKKYSIPTPNTVFPRSLLEVEEFASSVTYPVMLKGIDTLALKERTGVKMVLVDDRDALVHQYGRLADPSSPDLMLQEYIPGGSEAVWMFNGYFDKSSTCVFGLTGKKLRQYPAYTGVTSLGICLRNERILEQTKGFMKAIGYRGILDIGYKYDSRTDEYKLLDVNPRIGTTFRLFVDRGGTDVARTLYRDLSSQPVHQGASPEGRKWVVENFDLVSSIRYWRDGRMGVREWIQSYRGVEEASWLAADDLRPFPAMWWHSAQRVVRDSLRRKPTGEGGTAPRGLD